jgi:aspartate/methionine/tyrosine aminotransferase
VMSRAELEQIAAIAIEHDLWVIVDEVYSALTFERPHVSLAALPGMADRTVTVGSLSKSHAMTGWRTGWVAGPRRLAQHMDRLALNMLYGLPGFVQEAALTAFQHFDEVTQQMSASYKARRDIVTTALAGVPGLKVLAPEAGMFVLIDTRATGLPPLDLAWALFRETGVSVLDASAFGAAASGFLRMSFALGDDQLREACRRIGGFFEALAQRPRAPHVATG